jgi:hypothetical protein
MHFMERSADLACPDFLSNFQMSPQIESERLN